MLVRSKSHISTGYCLYDDNGNLIDRKTIERVEKNKYTVTIEEWLDGLESQQDKVSFVVNNAKLLPDEIVLKVLKGE